MMGFGTFGAANSSSSSSSPAFSNLSALAPPFSIDRSVPNKLISNPMPHYSELTCGIIDRSNPNKLNPNPIPPQYSELTCGVEPFSHTWQYSQPSAPRSELIGDSVVSVAMPSIPPASDVYQFSASAASTSPSSGYWSSQPFYSSYVPPMADEEDHMQKDSGPRYDEVPHQVDYMQGLYDLEYGPRWTGANMGSSYGNQQVDELGSMISEKANLGASHSYSNQLNQGHGTEYGSNYKEGTGVACEPFSLVSDSNVHTTYTGMRHMEDKSCLEQIHSSFLPPDFSNKHMSAASSSLLLSQPGLSSETHNTFLDYHQNSCSENKNSLWPGGSPFTPLVSTVRSSPAVVIRPPPTVSGVFGQNGVPRSIACNNTAGCTVFSDFDLTGSSNTKYLGQKLNAEDKEYSYDTDLLSLSNRVNDQIFGSTSATELSAPRRTKNAFDHDTEVRFVSEPLKLNVLDGFSEVQVAPADLSSDSVDRHSVGVDSPCWKGARVSQFSWLDAEDDSFNNSKRNEVYSFDLDKHENILSGVDSTRTSGSACEGNKSPRTEFSHDGDLSTSNCVKPVVRVSAVTRSIGVQISKDIDAGVPNNLESGFDMKISKSTNSKQLIGEIDTSSALNYVSDGDIAVHAAEKVLASPSSQEDTAEGTKIQPDPIMDVATLIRAMHNFSELLLVQQSNDAFILEEKDTETLKLIINNIDSCMSKKIIQPINGKNLDYPVGSDTSKLVNSRNVAAFPNMSTTSEDPHETSELKDSDAQRGYWSMYEEEYDNSGNKNEKSPVFSSLKDDLDLTKDDHVAMAIKKVLDENFNFNEEMHSQAHLFKSLWLEAEAKLCSVSYKARFDRMKLEMEKLKPKPPIGDETAVERLSKLDYSRIINTDAKLIRKEYDGLTVEPVIANPSPRSIAVHSDETETSTMARLSILKSREDNVKPINDKEEKHPEVAGGDSASSIMDRFNILMSRGEKSKSFHPEEENTPEVSSAGFADQNHLSTCIKDHYASPGKLNSSVANVPMIPSFYDSSKMMNQQYSLWQGSSSSSDWEHVMKDDFGWKNS